MKKCHIELFITARQAIEIRNAIAKSMSTGIKLTKAQLFKTIQSGGFFSNMFGNLAKKVITDLVILLAKDNLSRLVCNLASNAKNKFERKTCRKVAVRAGKGFTLFISNEDMNDIIKIIKSLKD